MNVRNENHSDVPLLFSLLFFLCFVLVYGLWFPAAAQTPEEAEVKTSGAALVTRLAPGEFLPISVKLINFGSGRRVDVTIEYQILDSSNTVVVSESETVAVETSASFIKILQVPHGTPQGSYRAYSSIVYAGQEVPATANYQFTVERKIAGMFVSQMVLYGTVTLLVGIAFAVVSRLTVRQRRASRFAPHDYSGVPKHDRVFYEMVSDTMAQMRYRLGDKAVALARNIDGLTIDEERGRVLAITKDPAKIIALLVLRYENQLGKKISFALRRPDKETRERLAPVDKNLVLVRKYFE